MEESEKRKERLKAMRLQASSSSSQETLISSSLSNPFLQNQDSNLTTTTPPPRFDYYTDPMAAYKDKSRPLTPNTTRFPPSFQGPRNPEMRPVGGPQFHHNYSSHQGAYQGGHSPRMPGPTSSPMGIRSPFPMLRGNPNVSSAPGSGSPFNNYSSPGSGYGCTPYPVHQGSPNFGSPQLRGHWSNSGPSPGPGRGGGPSPGPGRGGGPSPGPGRGSSPSPGPGRGRGQWSDTGLSPNSRYSSGRGRGGNCHNSQGKSFYNRSMVEDPWESLTPVLWQGVKVNDMRSFGNSRGSYKGTPTFHKSFFQRTPSAKKARVSDPFDASNSKQSLAEFLSESFDEENENVENVSVV